ncbi:MAG: CocE/NonD family hydrolase [Gemmatimonadales bacterium]
MNWLGGSLARRVAAPAMTLLLLGLPASAVAQDGRDSLVVGVQRFGVWVPMRDGVRLSADLWLPDSTGRHPTIVLRTPYIKTPQFRRYGLAAYVRAGFAVMVQDTRGRGDSEGEFDFYFPEGRDGYDTIEWIARQPWSSGLVGMDGGSYLAGVQWLAARERPPSLACMVPTAPSGRIFDEVPYLGGAFRAEWALPWLNDVSGRVSQGAQNAYVDWRRIATHSPLLTADDAFGRRMPLYRAFLLHDTLDEYWSRIQLTDRDMARIDVPSLTVTGWFDGDQIGALYYWDLIERRGTLADRTRLIIGPWTHAMTYLGGAERVGAFELGKEAIIDIQAERIAFFASCLRPGGPRFERPRVRVFVTGANRWVEADRYPLPEVRERALYLRSDGSANGGAGGGRLEWSAPGRERPDSFTYDPTNPVPSMDVALDHRSVESRPDVLVYSSEPLTEPVDVVGRVFVELHASTDARDTDFTAKLLDVYPDGRSVLLGPAAAGVKRARYREGYERQVPLAPGSVERYRIELYDVGHRFLPGHRIRLQVSSSAFPFVDANRNTGLPVATDTTWTTARQTIWHDAERPSRILLPVLPPDPRLPR